MEYFIVNRLKAQCATKDCSGTSVQSSGSAQERTAGNDSATYCSIGKGCTTSRAFETHNGSTVLLACCVVRANLACQGRGYWQLPQ